MDRVPVTLCLLAQDDSLLLGMKKRGFGMGKWNGFGGKINPGETIEEAALREFQEECGLTAKYLEPVGVLDFDSPGKFSLRVHVFGVNGFEGEPAESEEMLPQWFKLDEIPYDSMWPDDRHWLPLFLEGKKFNGTFLFGDGDTILEHSINVL